MEYIELRTLLNKCVAGEIQLNKPIMLTSRDRTETTTITFLNHLLKYNKIKKDKLFTFYFQILSIFNKAFTELMEQNTFKKYIQHVKKEWEEEDNILYEDRVNMDNSNKTIEELLENINILCGQFRELNDKVRTNNMNDVLVEDEMMDHMDGFLDRIRELKDEITDINSMLEQISSSVDNLNISILLDLSMKDKSIYLMHSKIDDDVKIPQNINIVFLNYVYVINLIKKHLIYYKRIISKVTEISGNMGKYVEENKDTVQSKDNLFSMKQQDGLDDYISSLDAPVPASVQDEEPYEPVSDEEPLPAVPDVEPAVAPVPDVEPAVAPVPDVAPAVAPLPQLPGEPNISVEDQSVRDPMV